jgi:hypothetical protein
VHEGEITVEGTFALASAPGGGRPPEPKLDSLSRIRIGQGLRAIYSDLIREPLPAHLLTLLNQAADPEEAP